jgi:hypothetical protein
MDKRHTSDMSLQSSFDVVSPNILRHSWLGRTSYTHPAETAGFRGSPQRQETGPGSESMEEVFLCRQCNSHTYLICFIGCLCVDGILITVQMVDLDVHGEAENLESRSGGIKWSIKGYHNVTLKYSPLYTDGGLCQGKKLSHDK